MIVQVEYVTMGLALLTLLGVALTAGKLTNMITDNRTRIEALERDTGAGTVSRADLLARMVQVERNTASIDGVMGRVARLEATTELHAKFTAEQLEKLDRGQQHANRILSNAMFAPGALRRLNAEDDAEHG